MIEKKELLARYAWELEKAYRAIVRNFDSVGFDGPAWDRFWKADKEIHKLLSPYHNRAYNVRWQAVERVESES